jgi:hypothetical protein
LSVAQIMAPVVPMMKRRVRRRTRKIDIIEV